MFEWILPLGVFGVFAVFTVVAFLRNRRHMQMINSANIECLHPIDLVIGMSDSTYGMPTVPSLTGDDVMAHMIRIYLDGNNSPTSPWRIISFDRPSSVIDQTRWGNFLRRDLGQAASWNRDSWWIYIVDRILRYFYPPLGLVLLRHARLARAVTVSRVVARKGGSIWSSSRARAVGDIYSIKFGCDASSLSVGWIDIFDIAKQPGSWKGTPTFPLVARLGGDGSYLYPHCVDRTDAYVNSLWRIVGEDVWFHQLAPGLNGLFSSGDFTSESVSALVEQLGLSSVLSIHLAVMAQSKLAIASSSPSTTGSYTSLRDALVEQTTTLDRTDASSRPPQWCIVFSRPGEPILPTILTTRISPLSDYDNVERDCPITESVVQPADDSDPRYLHRLITMSVPVVPSCSPKVFHHSLVVSVVSLSVLVGLLQSVILHGYQQVNLYWFWASLLSPPMSTEVALALCLSWLLLGPNRHGHWFVLFVLTSLPMDVVGMFVRLIACTGFPVSVSIIGQHVFIIGAKLSACAVTNRIIATSHYH